MAIYYVKSGAAGAADGSTWADAYVTVAAALAVAAAGDTIYVSDAHAETQASAITWTSAGTAANPISIICADDAAEPPTSLTTTGTVTATSNSAITVNGSLYVRGLTLTSGSGGTTGSITLANSASNLQEFDTCTLSVAASGTTQRINIGVSSNNISPIVRLRNVTVGFASMSQRISVTNVILDVYGLVVPALTTLFETPNAGRFATATISSSDLSTLNSAAVLVVLTTASNFNFVYCKLPASWSGSVATPTAMSGVAKLYNCDSTDTNYRLWTDGYYGSVQSETALVKTGGASDGVTAISRKMTSSANVKYLSGLLESPYIAKRNSTVGSAITVTVDILRDSATNLTDGEIWLEVQYFGTSGFPLGTFITDAKANVFSSAADQADSSATWTTTGMANPNTQKLNVTFTPQEIGYIQARVVLAKASTTVYYDPELQVS